MIQQQVLLVSCSQNPPYHPRQAKYGIYLNPSTIFSANLIPIGVGGGFGTDFCYSSLVESLWRTGGLGISLICECSMAFGSTRSFSAYWDKGSAEIETFEKQHKAACGSNSIIQCVCSLSFLRLGIAHVDQGHLCTHVVLTLQAPEHPLTVSLYSRNVNEVGSRPSESEEIRTYIVHKVKFI